MSNDSWLKQTTSGDNAKGKYYQLASEREAIFSNWLEEMVEEAPIQEGLFSLKMFLVHDQANSRILSLSEEERQTLPRQLTHSEMREELLSSNSKDTNHTYDYYLILSRVTSRVSSQLSQVEDTIQQ